MIDGEHRLWYDAPADDWLAALPLGDGKLAAMIFGGVARQRIQVNHGSAWSGSPRSAGRTLDHDQPPGTAVVAEIREALTAGDHARAEAAAIRLQDGDSQSYLPFVDLSLEQDGVGEALTYRRELDLSTATHSELIETTRGSVRRTAYVAADPSVLVLVVESDLPTGLRLGVDSPLRLIKTAGEPGVITADLQLPSDVDLRRDSIGWDDDPTAALRGAVAVAWRHDGAEVSESETLRATGVRRCVIMVTATTGHPGLAALAAGRTELNGPEDCRRDALDRLRRARAAGPDTLQESNLAAFVPLYTRVALQLSGAGSAEPTDRRLLRANQDPRGAIAADPGLAELLFNYGRYLLISSSRPGGHPANLQGIWNDRLPAPWRSNYTININLQMNYWSAEATGLTECLEPLYDLIDVLRRNGAGTARDKYGLPGWLAHHNTDGWGYTAMPGAGIGQPRWSMWPLAGFWLVRHLTERLTYRWDESFARERVWPALHGAAEFGLAWLIDGPDGTLGTAPSTSPENAFLINGESYGVGSSSTMDLTMISETLRHLVELADRLGRADDPVVRAAAAAADRIPAPAPGRDGLIREWLADPEQSEPHHRHVSHLYFLYPGDHDGDPDRTAAAAASLDARGDESTGWSLAWKLALRARLGQPTKVSDLLRLVFRDMTTDRGGQSGGLYPNLFAAHPPYQIDGNFGYVAGLLESLLQSHSGELILLPALPPELSAGSLSRVRARGGLTVSLRWRDGALAEASVIADTDRELVVRWPEDSTRLTLRAGTESSVL
ncbi:glycoside hydrolase family 95 protein [Microlunatus speluncae]|uniref:glycoside hydrolase family 95 protein n=1 Tax=Microlunatus speluncae TaxID=2594267 RepID=UPI00126632A3|nr:glycoside hydrolase family 95 protein [Microlunatus speluncae]